MHLGHTFHTLYVILRSAPKVAVHTCCKLIVCVLVKICNEVLKKNRFQWFYTMLPFDKYLEHSIGSHHKLEAVLYILYMSKQTIKEFAGQD